MIKPVRLDQEAEEEVGAAVAWYEAQRPGLGQDLLDALEEAKARLAEAPRAHPLVPGVSVQLGVRRCPVLSVPLLVSLRRTARRDSSARDRAQSTAPRLLAVASVERAEA
jgi:hypothetical protein